MRIGWGHAAGPGGGGAAALVACLLWPLLAGAAERLPIFDTHVHYSRDAWQAYDIDAVLELMDAAGVPRALVSSTPDDGTLRLYEGDPARIVPILRPYRDPGDRGDWSRNQEVVDYVKARLERGVYRGIGEFHLFGAESTATPQMREIVALAVARDIVVHVHSDAAPVRALLAMDPKLKVLWAHAGMSEPPAAVGTLLDESPQLWVELSFRAGDIAPGGRLDAAWRELFLRHPERFMIGSDTFIGSRWAQYPELIETHRRWLAQLPAEVAAAIAYKNAVREFGAGGAVGLGN